MAQSHETQTRYELAKKIAVDAGNVTLKYFQSSEYSVEKKSDRTPVTIADRDCETHLRKWILDAFPNDGIVGEEFGEQAGTSGYRWILDPIDGTKSFISGVPLYGTMVGLEFDSDSVVGVVYIPGLDEGVFACKGHGCWHFKGNANPTEARVSNRKLEDGVFVTSEVKTFAERNSHRVYQALETASYITRTWGDCYGYMKVATGEIELMVDPILSIWDAAAIKPIIEEAGGAFVDWQGNPSIYTGDGIGCSKENLEQVIAITKDHVLADSVPSN